MKIETTPQNVCVCVCPLNVNGALPACWWISSRCILVKAQSATVVLVDIGKLSVGLMGMYSPLWDHWSRLFSFPLCRPVILCLSSSHCHSPLRPSLIYSSVSPIRCASHGWLHRQSFIVRLWLQRRISRSSTCRFLSCHYHTCVHILEFEQVHA